MKNLGTYLIILVCIHFSDFKSYAQTKVSAKKIYLDYTKGALDSAYNQVYWAPNYKLVFSQLNSLNKLAQAKIGDPKRIQYDSSVSAQLDLYAPKSENAPIHIHIHGGAWRGGNGSGLQAYDARKFVESGVLYIAPDYELVTDSNRSLYPMVDQLRSVIIWTYQQAKKYGGNPHKIYISGHSAGAHLAGVLITTDWTQYGLPADVIKGAFLSSGMYDLYPVSLSSRNEYVEFTDKMIKDLSPMNHIMNIQTPVILVYGTQESPEFKKQSQAFAEALRKQSKDVKLHILEGYNHFEIMIAHGNLFDLPGELMLKQMNID